MTKITREDRIREEKLKTLMATNVEVRVGQHLSFFQRIECLEDEMKTCLPEEVAMILEDIADIRKEAKRLGVGARTIAAAIKAAARANREAAEAERAAA